MSWEAGLQIFEMQVNMISQVFYVTIIEKKNLDFVKYTTT